MDGLPEAVRPSSKVDLGHSAVKLLTLQILKVFHTLLISPRTW